MGKKCVLAAWAAACLLLCGCAALLERSYGVVEPYADRYWNSGVEDTLKVDNYQDLVNSLLMLIEQREEDAVIRCYNEVASRQEALKARDEVRWETMLGSYLLQNIRFTFEDGANYGTAAFHMTYRQGAEDLEGVEPLSDSQSLVDLLRLSVREQRERLTVRFTYEASGEEVSAVVNSYWEELCRDEMAALVPEEPPEEPAAPEGGTGPAGEAAEAFSQEAGASGEGPEALSAPGEAPSEAAPPEEDAEPPASGPEEPDPVRYPPCPWVVRFYPHASRAEVVEILLKSGWEDGIHD